MRSYFLFLCLFIFSNSQAQLSLPIKVTAGENKEPLAASITLKGTTTGVVSDQSGNATVSFPAAGMYMLLVTATGFDEQPITVAIPYLQDTLLVQLNQQEDELDEVIVQSTRTSRTIANVPTRVETVALEEIDEKNNMRPANVAMLLHESTGIQVQQTSATSGNAGIHIQGLDGRYTQLLKDGFANFGNFSSGLSVLEIPPLDLKQVEIIKGPASPLYGGGAIAGVVNFISKTPKEKPEYSVILNQSTIGQTNIGGFSSARNKKAGFTLLALYNKQKVYDVDKDGFTEIPKSSEATLHPKLFLYLSPNTTFTIGNSLTAARRTGGDVYAIEEGADATHQYLEQNKTVRNITTLEVVQKMSTGKQLALKQSFSVFDRTIQIPAYEFAGTAYNAYTDVIYISNHARHALVLGGNFVYDAFKERKATFNRNNTVRTGGAYGQHTWDATENIKVESGLRIDVSQYANAAYHNTEMFVLPRLSVLFKYNAHWSSRIGAGLGYKTPTLFTEETETIQYRNVAPLDGVQSERSYGGTADVDFKTAGGRDLTFSFNHMFFYTRIQHPLVLEKVGADAYHFYNADKPMQSAGFETNARLVYHEVLKMFVGYTFTQAKALYATGNQKLPLVPQHKWNTALIYEKEGFLKVGLEGYITGRQYLSTGTRTPAFSEFGLMAEKPIRQVSLFINLENLTDARQSRYKRVVNGSPVSPTFDEIWMHTEGFVMNGGIKWRF